MKRYFAVVVPCVVGLLLGSAAHAAVADEASAVPSFEDVPLFRLAGAAGVPAYLKAGAATLADERGISAKGDLRTTASDFVNRDFTFDIVYRFLPGERSIFRVGIGSGDWEAVSRVHGPGFDGKATFGMTAQGEQELGKAGDGPGPHLIRIQKRGKTLTFSLCPSFDGKTFDPTSAKTVPDLPAAAPLLKRHNSPLFVGTGSGGTIEAVRLIVDGKPAPTGAAADKPAAEAPPPGTAATDADGDADVWPPDDAPTFRLAGRSGLPAWLKASPDARASGTGMVAEEMRTADAALITKDFTFDVVFRFKNDEEQAILLVGLGALGRGVSPTVYSRIHGPGHGGTCTFNVASRPELELGKLSHNAGPHLFRLEKRGNTLTMAISPEYDGKFDPVASKTVPDLKAAAPGLTPRDGVAFIKGATTIEAVRLWVDGKPVGAAKPPPAVAKVTNISPSPATRSSPPRQGGSLDASVTETARTMPGGASPPSVGASGEPKVGKVARRQTSVRGLTVTLTDTGAMLGGTTDLILTATPGEARPDTPVGPQMELVVDDVLRALRVRYPAWEAERVELSFDDRLSNKDGSSIGAAVGALILSMLEGFEIDPKFAITGDVTADGKVRPIGGVAAKIRAATNAEVTVVALPTANYDQVIDALVYESPALLAGVQVIGVATLDETAAVARADRPAKLAEAVKLFAEVQTALEKSPSEIRTKAMRDKLTRVTDLAPNHFSGKLLLLVAQDKQPRRLSSAATLYYLAVAMRGVMPALEQQALAADRSRVTPVAVREGMKSLDRLRWIADPTLQSLADAYRGFVRAVNDVQTGRGSVANLRAKARAVRDAEAKVNANRDLMEKMLKEGV